MIGIVSAILFGIVATAPEREGVSGTEGRDGSSSEPIGENGAVSPPRPVVYVASTEVVRATIYADAQLQTRWRRGSALLGVGIATTVGAGAMLVGAAFAAEPRDWCGTSSWTQDGHTVTMNDPCPSGIGRTSIGLIAGSVVVASAGAVMMGLGIRDRVIAKRAARRRLSIAAAPTRDGASFAFTLRF